MQRTRVGVGGGFESLISTGKEMLGGGGRKLAATANSILSKARFRGKLGSAIAVITSLIVGFLTLPNNILYLIDSSHATKIGSRPEASTPNEDGHHYAYIHAGIAVVVLGCLAMVVSIVLSFFAAKSKRKMDESESDGTGCNNKGTRTVLACLTMMNLELFMSVIAGCMELLYRPLIADEQRLHNTESAIAVFNIIIYAMYVITMILTSMVLKEKHVDGAEYRRMNMEPLHTPRDSHLHTPRSCGESNYYSQSSMYL